MKKLNLLICFIFLILNLVHNKTIQAQTHLVGLKFGKGKIVTHESLGMCGYNNPSNTNVFNGGLTYSYIPKKAIFNLNTGLSYVYKDLFDNTLYLNYLRVPLGIDFTIGNKIQPVLGVGFSVSLLLKDNNKKFNPNLFQLGFFYKGGILVKLTKKISAGGYYLKNKDVTPIFSMDTFDKFGNKEKNKILGSENFISISVFYTLNM